MHVPFFLRKKYKIFTYTKLKKSFFLLLKRQVNVTTRYKLTQKSCTEKFQVKNTT